ncbi:TIGR02301 family protein [Methylobacterium sp. A54F]
MTRCRLVLGLLAVLAALPQPAEAQSSRGGSRTQQKPAEKPAEKDREAPAPAEAPAPYDRDLMRLSEVIGSLAFLRGVCASPDAVQWPARMKALIDTEGTSAGRRDRLAGAYNRGYRSYALTYRVCTPAAHEAADRFLAEGAQLSRALAGRYGG